MESYTTEEQQVEALKAWWKANGSTVLLGLAAGLATIGGWQLWQNQVAESEAMLSAEYQQISMLLSTQKKTAAIERGQQLLAEAPDSAYANFSGLVLARLATDDGDTDKAIGLLRNVIDHGANDAIRRAARIRLARLLAASGKTAEALATLDTIQGGIDTPLVLELRGDLLLAQGDAKGARAAYIQALANSTASTTLRPMLEMKLNDIGPGNESGA